MDSLIPDCFLRSKGEGALRLRLCWIARKVEELTDIASMNQKWIRVANFYKLIFRNDDDKMHNCHRAEVPHSTPLIETDSKQGKLATRNQVIVIMVISSVV